MSHKDFDCVEMMHKGQEAVRKKLKGLTAEEQLEYWRKRTEELRALQRQIKNSKAVAAKR